jgi:hypothetical protein
MPRFKVGQLVRVIRIRSLAYGRVARVVMAAPHQVKVQFADLPKAVGVDQKAAGCLALFENDELTLVQDVPAAAFYLLVTVVERDGDRRHVHHCLAHGQRKQCHPDVADSVARSWCGIGGKWDADEHVYRFSLRRFVLAEDWHEISLAEYVNLRSVLSNSLGKLCHRTVQS